MKTIFVFLLSDNNLKIILTKTFIDFEHFKA